MKTKDYVRLFKLDKPFYEFSREKFLNELGREFNQRVEDTRLERQRRNLEFTFSIFNKIVKEIEIKFWSISNKKHGLPFSEKLFSSFFAGWIIPIRKKYFPKEDHHSRNIFRIDDTGTHYLYITGVPKGTPKNSNALNVFKLLNAQYMTYFEDSEIGYLIQITQIWKK